LRERFPPRRLRAICRRSIPEQGPEPRLEPHPLVFPFLLEAASIMQAIGAGLFDGVCQGSDAVDGDVDLVAALEREGVGWNDARAGEQETAVGKGLVAEEVLDQSCRVAFQFGQCSDAGKLYVTGAEDVQLDRRGG